jgi:hypothetical protein
MEQCNIEKQNVFSGINPTAQSSSLLIPLVAILHSQIEVATSTSMSNWPIYLSYTDATIETTNETLFLIYSRVPTTITMWASCIVYLNLMWHAMSYNPMVGWLGVSCYLTLVKLQCPHIIHIKNLCNAEHRNFYFVKKKKLFWE